MATKYPWIYAYVHPLPYPPLDTLKESLRNHGLDDAAEAAESVMVKVTLSSDWWRPWIECERSTGHPRYDFCFDPLCGSLSVGPLKHGHSSNMHMFFAAEIWTKAPTRLVNDAAELRKTMPKHCSLIGKMDVVPEDPRECADWCKRVFNERPAWEVVSPWCSTFDQIIEPAASDATLMCAKGNLAVGASHLNLRSVWVQGLLVLLYTAVGVALCARAGGCAPPRLSSGPGPNDRVSEGLELLYFPLCWWTSSSDRPRANWQLILTIPGVLIDNPLDLWTALASVASVNVQFEVLCA